NFTVHPTRYTQGGHWLAFQCLMTGPSARRVVPRPTIREFTGQNGGCRYSEKSTDEKSSFEHGTDLSPCRGASNKAFRRGPTVSDELLLVWKYELLEVAHWRKVWNFN